MMGHYMRYVLNGLLVAVLIGMVIEFFSITHTHQTNECAETYNVYKCEYIATPTKGATHD